MDAVELRPRLHFLRFAIGHVYVWEDTDGLTLIDSGLPGSDEDIAGALRGLGHGPEAVRRLVLTHFHEDHAGSAARIAAWGDVEVLAHRAEAPCLRGVAEPPEPVLEDWERPLWDQVHSEFESVPVEPVRVDRELVDGDDLGFGGGARAVAVPGHTPGSVAVHLPDEGVLFTGDTIARFPDGTVHLGVFNVDRPAAVDSFRRQAELAADTVCFGHGEPLVTDAAKKLRAAAEAVSG